VLDLSSAEPGRPVVVSGLTSTAILSGSGEFALPWEARGAVMEWAGVYARGVRLTGRWTLEFRVAGESFGVERSLERLLATRWKVESDHRFGPVHGHQEVLLPDDIAGIARRWTLENRSRKPVDVNVGSSLVPYLAPIIVEGFKPYDYHATKEDGTVVVTSSGSSFAVEASPPPTGWKLNDEPWSGRSSEGELRTLTWSHDIEIGPGRSACLEWLVWGGRADSVQHERNAGRAALEQRPVWGITSEREWSEWLRNAPSMSLPDSPQLERAYYLARSALRALFTRPDPTLTGLVAGYPWYATLWCRDMAWSLPAVLWMGDFDWTEYAVDTVVRFQAPDAIALLGASKGELPMQIGLGPVFIYGTSDTTLYYPDLIRRLVDHSARPDLASRYYPVIERVIEWGRARTAQGTGLARNGGELEGMQAAAKMAGIFASGIDAVDTTIWDNTDRRDHAIDIQALWNLSLRSAARLATSLGRTEEAAGYTSVAASHAETVRRLYAWPEERYFFDSLHRDGTPVRKVRPNALWAVATGLLDGDAARRGLARALEPDLYAPWGLRTLSNRDPGFVPIAYHDGQVWTIATAWAAAAAFALGDGNAGHRLLTTIADRIVEERGLANECYRGDRGEPFDSCFLLGFSIGPFLTNLFDGLWGLSPVEGGTALRVEPRFPDGWKEAHLTGLRIGGGRVDLHWTPHSIRAELHGSGPNSLIGPVGSVPLRDGETSTLDLSPAKT